MPPKVDRLRSSDVSFHGTSRLAPPGRSLLFAVAGQTGEAHAFSQSRPSQASARFIGSILKIGFVLRAVGC